MYEYFTLENSTKVYLVPQESTASITVLVMFPVGSRYESEQMSGVSHYIEHLMFKGTKKRPNTLVLTREIDRLGADYNAFTGKEYTGYYIKADASHVETVLDILSDMLHDSLFNPEEMEREKGVIVEEIKMYKDNPVLNIDNVFEELLYRGCALGRDIPGTKDHVLSYKHADVLAFKEQYYQPHNTTVVVAGAIPETMKHSLQSFFGSWPSQVTETKYFEPKVFGSTEPGISVEPKETDQAQLMLGFPAFSYSDRAEADIFELLNAILGGSMSSRLFIEIRERRGLAYMIRSGADMFRDTGYVYVRAGLDVRNILQAISVIRTEIEKLLVEGVTDQELQDAKTRHRGLMALAMEDSSEQATWYAKQALFMDSIRDPFEHVAIVKKVTKDDVLRVAKKIFNFELARVAVIGNTTQDSITLT